MPTPVLLIRIFSFDANVPPANIETYLVAAATPIERLVSDEYKYPSVGPLIVQEPTENPLLLIPKSIKLELSVPLSAVIITSEDALVPLFVFLRLICP